MPLILTSKMRRHFHETGTLEVEDLFPKKILDEIRESLKGIITSSNLSFRDRYLKGRDLFRTQEPFRRLEMRRETIQFISDLTQTHYLHLAGDQLFDWRGTADGLPEILPVVGTFEELMSINPLLLSMLVCLEGEGTSTPGSPFPAVQGNATFFFPNHQIRWNQMIPKGKSFLYVAYAPRGAMVRFSEKDIHSGLLKRMEYQEFSPIEGRTHPLFRL